MRRLVLSLLSMLLFLPLFPVSLETDSGSGMFYSDNAAFSFSSGQAWFQYGPLEYGDISRNGLLNAISDPHSYSFSLFPTAAKPGRNGMHDGFVLTIAPFSVLWSTDERPVAAIGYSDSILVFSLAFAFAGEEDSGFHTDQGMSGEYPSLYSGLSLSFPFSRISAIISFSPDIGVRSFVRAEAAKDRYSLSVSYGSLIGLYSGSSDDILGVAGSFGRDEFLFSFSCSFGSVPVFSDEYLSRRAKTSAVLDFGHVRILSEMEYSFTKHGRRLHKESFSFDSDILNIGYNTENGFFIILKNEYLGFGWKDGSPFVSFTGEMEMFSARVKAEISTDGSFSLSLKTSL